MLSVRTTAGGQAGTSFLGAPPLDPPMLSWLDGVLGPVPGPVPTELRLPLIVAVLSEP